MHGQSYRSDEVEEILETFPLTSAELRSGLSSALERARAEYRRIHERIVLRLLDESVRGEYDSVRSAFPDMRPALFYQLAMGLVGVCDSCGSPSGFRCNTNSWSDFCSMNCAAETVEEKKAVTCQERYGTPHSSKAASVRTKMSESQSLRRGRVGGRKIHLDPPIPPAPEFVEDDSFFVYAILDPRKGARCYGPHKFKHEPFYIGKGQGDRPLDHYKGASSGTDLKSRKICAIVEETGEYPPYVISRCNSELEAYNREIELIALIGRICMGTGPLTNRTRGGEGCVGMDADTIRRISESNRRTKLRQFNYSIRDYLDDIASSGVYGQLGVRGRPEDLIFKSAPIWHKCRSCGNTFKRAPQVLLRGTGCSICRDADPEYARKRELRYRHIGERVRASWPTRSRDSATYKGST